jgi:putative transposase
MQGELLLVAIVVRPADVTLMMIFDHHLPCTDRFAMDIAFVRPAIDDRGALLAFPIAANLLERNFIAAAPNRIWLADITYVETDQGWLYLVTVTDLYSRKIVGWAMADHLRAEPPLAAFSDGHCDTAATRRPDSPFRSWRPRPQYASVEYRKMMQSAGFRASMSRRADCYDNVPIESFFHTLKTELVHHQHYATREEARRDIFAYIIGFYNRPHRHSAIGYLSPIELELKAA